jgi:hypothetical protein
MHAFYLESTTVILKFAREVPANKDIIESDAITMDGIDAIGDTNYFAILSYLLRWRNQ